MKLIGIEEHVLTAEVRHAWDAIGLNAVDPSVAFHSGVIERRLLDLAEARLATASGMFLPHYVERAISVVGSDRLLFSTDFPYQYRPGRDARRFLENCGLDAASKADLAHGNWTRLTEGCTGGEREPDNMTLAARRGLWVDEQNAR